MTHAPQEPLILAPAQRLANEPFFDLNNFPTHLGSSGISREGCLVWVAVRLSVHRPSENGMTKRSSGVSQFTNPLALTFPFEPHQLVKNRSCERPLVAAKLATLLNGR